MTIIPARLRGFPAVAWPRSASAGASLQIGTSAQLLLASLSGAAGVIHLVMVPSHMDSWKLEGVGFALAGWSQLAVAMLALTRPTRLLFLMTIALNAALIGAWALSRTAGLPFGPHAWHAESASFIDLSCVGIEAAVIAAAGMLWIRPRLGSGWGGPGRLVSMAASLGVLVLATAAVASPSARNHGSHFPGGHHAMDDKGLSLLTNGSHHQIVQYDVDAATQAALDTQIDVTRRVAVQYPTVAAAEAGGYRRAGPYTPGLGAHYIKYSAKELNADGVVDGDDVRYPLAIIYDGTDPGSRVAGFMYYSMSPTEPQGFVGPNDVWHYHENICLKFGPNGQIDAPFGADFAATEQQCASVGGTILPATQWMLHVWSVPGYDNVDGGVFAEVNPALMCPDGTYYQLPPDQWSAQPLSTCRV